MKIKLEKNKFYIFIYYSKTVRLLKKLLDEPELLEKPLSEDLEY